MCALVAIHIGAGHHQKKNHEKYQSLSNDVCKKILKELLNGLNAVASAAKAVKLLEDSPLTNAGTGSFRTINGTVECDASIMDGKSLLFGAVGGVSDFQNPILAAKCLLDNQLEFPELSFGRISPSILTGTNAKDFISSCKNSPPLLEREDNLYTHKTDQQYKEAMKKLSVTDNRSRNFKRKLSHSLNRKLNLSHIRKKSNIFSSSHQDLNYVRRKDYDNNNISEELRNNKVINEGSQCIFHDEFDPKQSNQLTHSKDDDRCGKNSNDLTINNVSLDDETIFIPPNCKKDNTNDDKFNILRGGYVNEIINEHNYDGYSEYSCNDDDYVTDTVGCICMDLNGNVASAVSSGGILLKQSGRVGPAASYGAGCWAENTGEKAIAVATSGCGEHIMRTLLAEKISESIFLRSNNRLSSNFNILNKDRDSSHVLRNENEDGVGETWADSNENEMTLDDSINILNDLNGNLFATSPFLRNIEKKYAGVLTLIKTDIILERRNSAKNPSHIVDNKKVTSLKDSHTSSLYSKDCNSLSSNTEVILQQSGDNCSRKIDLVWAHSTPSFCIGYAFATKHKCSPLEGENSCGNDDDNNVSNISNSMDSFSKRSNETRVVFDMSRISNSNDIGNKFMMSASRMYL